MAIPKPATPIPQYMRNADPEIANFIDNTDVPGAAFYLWNLLKAKADKTPGVTHPVLIQNATNALNKAYTEIKNDPVKWVANNISVPITQEMRNNAAIGVPIQSNAFITNNKIAQDVGMSQVDYLIKKNVELKELEDNARREATKYKLQKQILDQGTTGSWTGEGFGSVTKNASAIADSLMSVGIDDIRQFGQLPDGRYGNKITGQAISTDYSRAGGNIFSGTFTGEDSTGFGVQFAPDGTPYFYTQKGASTSDAGDIVPIISLGLTLFAPGIGGAIGSAITGTAATTVASQVIGSAVVQGVLAEAQGGDFLDGAIKGAVTAGVAPAVANTVGAAVADVMADSAVKNVVANAVASSASSAVTAALTGGDVEQAALTGALAGAGGSIGREFATAADLGTTPFSEQTQMLAGQEQGLGTAGGLGANIGQAVGAIASGADSDQAILQALVQATAEKQAATPKTVEENISQAPVLTPTEAEMPPPAFIGTPQLVTEPVDATISEPVQTPPPSPQEKLILDLISQELGLVEGGLQEGVAGTIPEVIPGIQEGIVETTPGLDFGVQQGVVGTIPEDLGVQPGVVATIPEDLGLQTGVAGTIPEDLGVQGGIVETVPEDLGLQEGVAGTIPSLDQDIIDLITQPPVAEQNLALDVLGQPLTPEAVDITPVPQENLALDVLGEPLTTEAVDIEPISQDPLLGLSSQAAGEAEQEAIDYQALEGLSDPSVGFGEEAAIDQANLDALGDLSSAEVGQGEQEAIDRQALEELSSAEVGLGEQEAINRQALEELSSAEVGEGEQDAINRQALEELSSAEVGLGEQEAINQQALEELSSAEVGLGEQEAIDRAAEGIDTVFDTGLEVVDRPYIRDFYISGGRRRSDTFGPTVTNLSQAISAPFFPSSPVSGLTSYRGAGEIESKSTGKPRRDVWNEASLRLKDALGL